jgi:sigma-E factor negative regulatory protein RseA
MNEELDSQLSAMFDNELPSAQCELLARRLSKDEELKARWGRYAAIGATIRAEGGARLSANMARRVSAVISSEPAVVVQQPVANRKRTALSKIWMPLGSVAVAASVAAGAILWVRFQGSPLNGTSITQTAQVGGAPGGSAVFVENPTSYVVPKAIPRRSVVPSTQLANYVVAHSEFSSPVNRRNILSALMASESGTAGAPAGSEEPSEDVYDDAKSAQ